MGETEDEFEAALRAFEAVESIQEEEPQSDQPAKQQEEQPKEIKAVGFLPGTYYRMRSNFTEGLNRQSTPGSPVLSTIGTMYPTKIDGTQPSLSSLYGGYSFIDLKILGPSNEEGFIEVQYGIPRSNRRIQVTDYAYLTTLGIQYPIFTSVLPKAVLETYFSKVEEPSAEFAFSAIPDQDILVSTFNDAHISFVEARKKAEEEARKKEEERKRKLAESAEAFKNEVLETAKGIYGDNAGFITNVRSTSDCYLVNDASRDDFILGIRFPEVTISNRENRSRELKDLYVAFLFKKTLSNNYKMSSVLYGTRATLKPDEYLSNYRHSHLCAQSYYTRGKFSNFCLGGGTPTAYSMANLADSFDIGMFELMLHQLKPFVEYESLEGGPYFRMQNIVNNSSRNRTILNSSIVTQEVNNYLTYVNNSGESLPVSLQKIDGQDRITLDINSKEFIDAFMNITQYKAVKTAEGNYTLLTDVRSVELSDQDIMNAHRTMFNFNDEVIEFTIETSEDQEQKLEPIPHPAITRELKVIVENQINKFYNNHLLYEFS